jgi:hypothetical protein
MLAITESLRLGLRVFENIFSPSLKRNNDCLLKVSEEIAAGFTDKFLFL